MNAELGKIDITSITWLEQLPTDYGNYDDLTFDKRYNFEKSRVYDSTSFYL